MDDEITDYLRSFRIALKARNRADRTVETYSYAVEQLAHFLESEGLPTRLGDITRREIEAHLAWLVGNRSPATAAQRFASLQQYFKWLVEEGEIDSHPMERMKKPSIPDKPIPVLTDDDLRKLLNTCAGPTFDDRRDVALIRLFIDTGARLSEVSSRRIEDIDLDQQQMLVVTKGGHLQAKYFGSKATQAIDRYERIRRRHRYADSEWLWLSKRGRMTESGIQQMLKRRAQQAGIEHVHPHMFRHTFAHRWLSQGGNEGDLQRLMGWKDRQMLDRYGASGATARAKDAHKRMALGDRL